VLRLRRPASEYFGPSHRPGETVEVGDLRVRNESLPEVSTSDGPLDLLRHGDVLEHVPDHRRALTECARVLRPGGLMLFTAPCCDDTVCGIVSNNNPYVEGHMWPIFSRHSTDLAQ
jgi:SAM-dependent methyltransferase